jgi:hypothetical protein
MTWSRGTKGTLWILAEKISKILFENIDNRDNLNERIFRRIRRTPQLFKAGNLCNKVHTESRVRHAVGYRMQWKLCWKVDFRKYLDSLTSEVDHRLNILAAKLMIEEHITLVNSPLNTLQRNVHLLLEILLYAQTENIEPQIMSLKL